MGTIEQMEIEVTGNTTRYKSSAFFNLLKQSISIENNHPQYTLLDGCDVPYESMSRIGGHPEFIFVTNKMTKPVYVGVEMNYGGCEFIPFEELLFTVSQYPMPYAKHEYLINPMETMNFNKYSIHFKVVN